MLRNRNLQYVEKEKTSLSIPQLAALGANSYNRIVEIVSGQIGSKSGRRSVGLDVARAIAIVMVLASHVGDIFALWFGAKPIFAVSFAGFFGVELFFVLSGYLIGGILIEVCRVTPGWRSWRVFMVRRWLRTLPVYYAWIALLLVFWPPRFWEPAHGQVWADVLAYGSMTQNLAWPMVDGWFGVSWSLAVEEWFYLLFATVAIGGTLLVGHRRAFWTAMLGCLLAPIAARAILPADTDWQNVISKVVVLRLDSIGFGVLVSWLVRERAPSTRTALALAALGVTIIVGLWSGAWHRLFPVASFNTNLLFPLCSIGFALCLPAAAAVRRWPAVVAGTAGLLSRHAYSLYIVHLTILEFLLFHGPRWRLSGPECALIAVVAIPAASVLLTALVERPFMALRPRQFAAASGGDVVLEPGQSLAISARYHSR